MTKEKLKQIIVELVTDKQGCKSTDLIASDRFIQAWRELAIDETMDDLIDELVMEERLIQVRYVLSSSSFRLKSFLLPVGTHIAVKTSSKLEVIGEE